MSKATPSPIVGTLLSVKESTLKVWPAEGKAGAAHRRAYFEVSLKLDDGRVKKMSVYMRPSMKLGSRVKFVDGAIRNEP